MKFELQLLNSFEDNILSMLIYFGPDLFLDETYRIKYLT